MAKRNYRTQAKPLSLESAAYIAGYVDGEGCLYASLHKGGVYGVLEVSSVHRETLDEFVIETGVGCVQPKKRRKRLKNARQLFVWRVALCSVASLLSQLRPYLRLKAKQADLMLTLAGYAYPSKLYGDDQLCILREFRVLNKRGQLTLN